MSGNRVALSPIEETDLDDVAEFLHRELNSRVSVSAWRRAIVPPWPPCGPNHGFLLRAEGRGVVGVQLAFYSTRSVGRRVERFCNLGAWCVLDDYRADGLRLLRSVLRQRGYHFTDLSPSGNVVAINLRMRFRHLDTTAVLSVNAPFPTRPGTVRILGDTARIRAVLDPGELAVHDDHQGAQATIHLVVQHGGEHCYLILRRDRRKGLPGFGTLLYASRPAVLAMAGRELARYLLLRRGILFTITELRLVEGAAPFPGRRIVNRPKMFLSTTLDEGDIDYLYSELTCLAW